MDTTPLNGSSSTHWVELLKWDGRLGDYVSDLEPDTRRVVPCLTHPPSDHPVELP